MLLSYPYAVHRIGPRFRPKKPDPDPTHILVFRDLQDRVRFLVLNAVSARLVALLHEGSRTGAAALATIARELDHPNPAVVLQGGREILTSLRREEAVLGTWR
jgi:hypothetical protein